MIPGPHAVYRRSDSLRSQQATEQCLLSRYVRQHGAGEEGEQTLTRKEQEQQAQEHQGDSRQIFYKVPKDKRTAFQGRQFVQGPPLPDENIRRHPDDGDGGDYRREYEESQRPEDKSPQQ